MFGNKLYYLLLYNRRYLCPSLFNKRFQQLNMGQLNSPMVIVVCLLSIWCKSVMHHTCSVWDRSGQQAGRSSKHTPCLWSYTVLSHAEWVLQCHDEISTFRICHPERSMPQHQWYPHTCASHPCHGHTSTDGGFQTCVFSHLWYWEEVISFPPKQLKHGLIWPQSTCQLPFCPSVVILCPENSTVSVILCLLDFNSVFFFHQIQEFFIFSKYK